jgi:hypothetical protein
MSPPSVSDVTAKIKSVPTGVNDWQYSVFDVVDRQIGTHRWARSERSKSDKTQQDFFHGDPPASHRRINHKCFHLSVALCVHDFEKVIRMFEVMQFFRTSHALSRA